MRIGSLFSGIGGLELGLGRAGLGPVAWHVEIDPFCRRVLTQHWPNSEVFSDVSQLRRYPDVELICGGFPCQDVSSAGKRRGLGGAKSGLWYEYARVVSEVRPRFVVVENVASGASRWLPQVRRDLCALGYRTRAFLLSAADIGAPHLRRRIFVIAHPKRFRLREQPRGRSGAGWQATPLTGLTDLTGLAGDTHGHGEPALLEHGQAPGVRAVDVFASAWPAPPELRGVDDGIPNRVDRLRALGNAVVPQCAEVIGRIVLEMAA